MEAPRHVPVLPDEVLSLLAPSVGEVVLDATVGRGGHGVMIIPRLGPGGWYVGLDVDPGNVTFARDRLQPIADDASVRLTVLHRSFADAPGALSELGVAGVDGLLADLGFSSNQMDDASRGFAFGLDGPLDMRLDPSSGLAASELVNTLPERELADLIYNLGEERFSRRIARKIVEARAREPIQSTSELAELVRRAYGPYAARGRQRIHPATRTFMALRIAVNDELGALDALLAGLPRLLKPGGRAAIISFHSLEDRRVKHAFAALEREGRGERLTRKPVTPREAEEADNPRSRSAKLRALRRGTVG